MPPDENTPAPTRRFLPSSSSGAKPSYVAPTHKHAFQTPRSTHSVSASSFSATPRFQSGPRKEKDDIQTNFDDEAETPILPKVRITSRPQDVIEVDDYEHDSVSPLQHRNKFLTPLGKRRKTSHPDTKPGQPITISSSPELNESSDEGVSDGSDSPGSAADLDDTGNVGLKTPGTHESNTTTRFRATTSGVADSTPLSRSVFKSVAEDAQHAPTGSGSILPDVFSPSRRKGKRDYLPGSSADIVRNWILNIAAQESQAASNPEVTIAVREVVKDSSGRFVIVVDEDGSQWLLPEQQPKELAGPTTSCAELLPGSLILLKGQATKWPLHLDNARSDIHVAAIWELLSME